MWIIYSLLSAVSDAARLTAGKRLVREFDTVWTVWFLGLVTSLFLGVYGLFAYTELPWENAEFVWYIFSSTVFLTIGTLLLTKAMKTCDLSIVAPIMSTTPIFIVLWEVLFFGQWPSVYGLLGILMIVFGSYTLNLSKARSVGILEPLRAILRPSQGLLALLGAFAYSGSAMLSKLGLDISDPTSYTIAYEPIAFLEVTIVLLVLIALKKVKLDKGILGFPLVLIAQGGFNALNSLMNAFAFVLASASYVISIKRTSGLFGVLFGYLFFKEKGTGERFLGALIMVVGVAILSVWG